MSTISTVKGPIPPEEAAALKKTYGDLRLYRFRAPETDDDIVYRLLTVSDVRKLEVAIDRWTEEHGGMAMPRDAGDSLLFDECVLWPVLSPEEKMRLETGLVPSVISAIQQKSGYTLVTVTGQAIGPDVYSWVVSDGPVWGAPNKEDIEAAKAANPGVRLFKTVVGEYSFIIRPLNRGDIHYATQADDRYVSFASSCVVWPPALDVPNMPAGVVTTLGTTIEAKSGWSGKAATSELL